MEFDKCIYTQNHNYGFIAGEAECILLKTGAGGSIYGYENKYLKLADWLHNSYGSTVIVADTPVNADLEQDFCTVIEFVKRLSFAHITFIGVSRAAQETAIFAYRYPEIEKMLLINMPMMINWHKSKAGLQQLSQKQHCTLAFGTNDPSYLYFPFAKHLENERISVKEIPNVGHRIEKEEMQLLIASVIFKDIQQKGISS